MEYNTILTKEEYLQHTGIDLDAELTAYVVNDLEDELTAPRFIWGIEDWLKHYVYDHYDNDVKILYDNYPFTEHQIKEFKKATIAQIQYYLQNGTISNDSGYNVDTKQIVDYDYLERISISPEARMHLRSAGLCNLRRSITC